MKKYIITILLIGFTFSQSGENDERQDSTFIILKSGDSIRVKKFDASFTVQPMIKFDLEFSDYDSTLYEISSVNKVVDSEGNTSISRNGLLMVNYFQKLFNLSIRLILLYLIIS
tara:strand:+ start:132 stop:473 length:342 start_codon:yes stop_codon:yes gene_type:complete